MDQGGIEHVLVCVSNEGGHMTVKEVNALVGISIELCFVGFVAHTINKLFHCIWSTSLEHISTSL